MSRTADNLPSGSAPSRNDGSGVPETMGGPSTLAAAGLGRGIEIDDLWDAFSDEEDAPPPPRETVEQRLSDFYGDERYAVFDEVAKGGMGRVIRAVDRDIRRPVAMKVLLGAADEEKRARFIEEAQVTGQLEHPNIVPIHELGIDADGRLFFTMKMVRGRSLGALLDEIRDNPARADETHRLPYLLHALVHAANAVSYAHSRGVVHRDLKPGNIMVGDYGEVLVMDWGLAKIGATREFRRKVATAEGRAYVEPEALEPESGSVPHSEFEDLDFTRVESFRHDSTLMTTKDGTIAGTPAYMSPEQARGELDRIDERSDVYALGAVLYEILTLMPPVYGETDQEFLDAVKAGRIAAPENRAPRRDIPPALSRIAMKALRYSPKERYQTVKEFQAAVSLYMDGLTQAARGEPDWPAVAARNAWLARGFAIAAAIALGAASLYVLHVKEVTKDAQNRAKSERNWRIRAETERAAALERLQTLEQAGIVLPRQPADKQ